MGYRSQFKEIFQFVNLSLPSLAKKLSPGSRVKAWHPIRQYVSKGRVDTETEQGYLVIFDGEESKLFINEFEIAVVPAKPTPEITEPPPKEPIIIKAGINLQVMATLIFLLERKERLVNTLREVNIHLETVYEGRRKEIYIQERQWLLLSLDILNQTISPVHKLFRERSIN